MYSKNSSPSQNAEAMSTGKSVPYSPLYALNVCIGKYKRFGHYYSYILINNEWYKFDDLNVEKIDGNLINKDLPYIYGIYYINNEYLKTIE